MQSDKDDSQFTLQQLKDIITSPHVSDDETLNKGYYGNVKVYESI